MHKFGCVFSLFFLVKMVSLAQVSGKAVVDSTHMLIGDQMRLRIELSAQKDAVLQPIELAPVIAVDSVFEVLSESKWDTLGSVGDQLRLQKNLLFIAWDSGYHRLPAIPVPFKLSGKVDTFFTRDIPMQIDMPRVDTTLADIKPILAEPVKLIDFLWYFVGLALLVLVIVLVLVLRKRKTEVVVALPSVPQLLPHELALQQLEALSQQEMWQRGEVKGYHSALTHIVREYLENRYGIQALEQTTDEILAQLRQRDFDLSLSQKLGDVLQTADLVKFAKAEPTAEFHERAMEVAKGFVVETKPTVAQIQEMRRMEAVRVGESAGEAISLSVPSHELAGFWRRFFAFTVDMILLFVLIIATALVIGILANALHFDLAKVFIYVIYFCVIWAYSALLEYKFGATLGKQIFAIKVVNAEGKPISFTQSVVRTLSKFILSDGAFMLGYVLYFFDKEKRQTLHDKIAKTLVVKRTKSNQINQNPSTTL